MEDRFAVGEVGRATLCAVFDGHGGTYVAERASAMVLSVLKDVAGAAREHVWPSVFAELDVNIEGCGSTATLIVHEGRHLSLAWVGDSRALHVQPDSYRFITRPHRIDDPAELSRVIRAGAQVRPPYVIHPVTGRGLMITRSLGDRDLRHIGVISEPEISVVNPAAGDIGIVVATDGLWDVASAEEVAELCRSPQAQDAAEAMIELVRQRHGSDNATVVVLRF